MAQDLPPPNHALQEAVSEVETMVFMVIPAKAGIQKSVEIAGFPPSRE
jgi:hypothetical protein